MVSRILIHWLAIDVFFYARDPKISFNRQEIEKNIPQKVWYFGCPQMDFFRAWHLMSLVGWFPSHAVTELCCPTAQSSDLPNNTTSLWSSMANLTVCLQHKELPPLSIFVYLWNLLNIGKHLYRGDERIPILVGSNDQQIYANFEGFPL